MTLTVRLPPRTKSAAVKRALERLLARDAGQSTAYELGKGSFGADRTPKRDVARNTKRLLHWRRGAAQRS